MIRWPESRCRSIRLSGSHDIYARYTDDGAAPEHDVDALVERAADAVESLAREGLEATQQRFN